MLSATLPMHLIVTPVFWILVFKHSIKESFLDYVYFILAHGVTLGFLLFDAIFVVNSKSNTLKYQLVYIIFYGIFATFVLYLFDFSAYGFMNFKKSKVNILITACVPLILVFMNKIIAVLVLLRPGF